MQILKTNWLRAILSLTLLLGAFFVVRAMSEVKEEPKKEKWATMVTFRYEAPNGVLDPYSKAHVENTDNWKPQPPSCSSSSTPNAPCSIQVPLENTIDEDGEEIDASLVTINTQSAGAGRYIVATSSAYSNIVNTLVP